MTAARPVTPRLEIWGVEGLPEITAGDDLAALLMQTGIDLQSGDVIVVTSKIVSKAEDRLVSGTRLDHLDSETVRVVARRGDTAIVETRHGFVMAAAGIDASNVPDGVVALLPVDSDLSAAQIRETLLRSYQLDVAVIISDTMGRPWRDGVIDTAIGAAGIDVLWDLRGQRDTEGHLLEATVIAIADELASAADLVKGKLASAPVAVIRGFPFTRNTSSAGARPLVRRSADDMFRLGTREAMTAVVSDSAPVRAEDFEDQGRIDQDLVAVCVGLVSSAEVLLAVADDGRTVTATGDLLAVGYTFGRLAAALAAEGLRATAPIAHAGGAAVRIHLPREDQKQGR